MLPGPATKPIPVFFNLAFRWGGQIGSQEGGGINGGSQSRILFIYLGNGMKKIEQHWPIHILDKETEYCTTCDASELA